MAPIYVTEHLLKVHQELEKEYERLGRKDYQERERRRIDAYETMLSHINPVQQTIDL